MYAYSDERYCPKLKNSVLIEMTAGIVPGTHNVKFNTHCCYGTDLPGCIGFNNCEVVRAVKEEIRNDLLRTI